MKPISNIVRLLLLALSVFAAVVSLGIPNVEAADPTGTYHVNGALANGQKYKGELDVKKQGDVYQFSWSVGADYNGVGVLNGDVVAVAYTTGKNGQGCGVVNYQITKNGIDGRWGVWGANQSGTETGSRTGKSAKDIDGDYNVTGTNLTGVAYQGKLSIAATGATYKFSWKTGYDFEGTGIKQGSNVAAGFGGAQCGFISYIVQPDGGMVGRWGVPGSSEVGSETAIPK